MSEHERRSLAQELGAAIRRLRERRGWSQYRLAKRLGVTPGLVSRWEQGKRRPTLDLLVHLASVLGCQWHELLPEIPQNGVES